MTATQIPEPTVARVGDSRRIFEPLHQETDYGVEEVEGGLHQSFHGTFTARVADPNR